MGSLQERTFALSNGTIPDPLRPSLPQDWGFAPHPKLQSLLSQERVKIRTSHLARTITVSIRIIAHEKFWRKGSVGVSRDCPNFLGTPYYLRNGESYRFQIWPVHSEGPSEQKPIKNFREKEAWAYPGTAQFLPVPPIISRMGKATGYEFQLLHAHLQAQSEQKPIKNSGEVAVGVVRDSSNFFDSTIGLKTGRCYVSKFTAASRGFPCDSTASCLKSPRFFEADFQPWLKSNQDYV